VLSGYKTGSGLASGTPRSAHREERDSGGALILANPHFYVMKRNREKRRRRPGSPTVKRKGSVSRTKRELPQRSSANVLRREFLEGTERKVARRTEKEMARSCTFLKMVFFLPKGTKPPSPRERGKIDSGGSRESLAEKKGRSDREKTLTRFGVHFGGNTR